MVRATGIRHSRPSPKLAEDRAERLRNDPDKVAQELDARLRADLRSAGDFKRVHPLPRSGQDVPDDYDARLVVLGMDQPYSRDEGSPAEGAAKTILESRGQRAEDLSQHAGLPCCGQDPAARTRRGGAALPGVGIHTR